VKFFLFLTLLSSPSDSFNIVYYSGDRITFQIDSSLVEIYGKAEASYGNLHIWADTLLYNLEDKFLVGKSKVRFNDGNNDIKAERMTYDVDKKIGKAFKATTEIEMGWFYGEEIRYLEGKVLKINNGYFTTCELDPPHYWFYSPRMKVNIDKDLEAEPIVLLVEKIPLFFVPFWFQSIKKERSSGFVMPSFGSSSYGGRYIKNIGWYQTLGPYADATISLDYYTKQSVKSHLNARWKLSPYGDGNVNGSYIKERETNKKRWSLYMNNQSRLPGGIKMNMKSDISSDNEYTSDYEPGEVEKMFKEISYGGNISGHFFGFGLSGVMDYRKNQMTGTLRKKWPSANVTFPHFSYGPLNFRSSSKFLRDESSHWASGLEGKMNMGFNLLVFNINLGLLGSNDYYEREGLNVRHWSSNLKVLTRLYGVSLFGIPPITKFRQVLTPSISVGYAPEPDSFNVTALSGFSIPRGAKSGRISLNNLFQCKIGKKKYDFASLSLSSGYQPNEDKFSPVSVSGNFWVGNFFRQNYSTSYDLYTQELGDKKVNTQVKYNASFGGKPLDFSITHSVNFTQYEKIQQASMGVRFNPTPKWKLNIQTHYDFEKNRVTSSRIALIRDLHCWDLSMSLNTFGDRWDYNLKLQLKKLPELKLERETLRTFFP